MDAENAIGTSLSCGFTDDDNFCFIYSITEAMHAIRNVIRDKDDPPYRHTAWLRVDNL